MTSNKTTTILQYVSAEALQEHLGIIDKTAYYISGIVVFEGLIEFHLERFIWRLNGLDPKGQRPNTDGKPVSAWIKTLKDYADTLPESAGRDLLKNWSTAAECAAKIRNDIAHGVPVNVGGAVAFNRNPRWHGEIRSRDHTDFWATEIILNLVRDAMAVLVRTIADLNTGHLELANVRKSDICMKALRDAESILCELSDQRVYNPTFEKY